MRAVVDTNVLVSGLLHPARGPARVLAAIARRSLTPVVCSAVVAEYQAVLARPRLALPAGDVARALALIEALAEWVVVPPYVVGQPVLPDPADWPFLACALATGCPLITGNLKHFPPHLGVEVLSVAAWLQQGE